MSKKIRVGFVGTSCSGMPRRFASCMSENYERLELAMAWDEDKQNCAEFQKEYQLEKQAETPEEVADNVQLIIMDVKTRDTAKYACEVLKRGVPLYISKPLANNLENTSKILECAKMTETPLLSTSAMRYDDAVQQAARLVREQKLGSIQLAFIALHHTVNSYLTPESEWHVSFDNTGGPLVYLGVHGVDILDEIIGLEDIDELYSAFSTLTHGDHHLFKRDNLADTHAVNIKYKNGLIATLQLGNGMDYCYYGGLITGETSHYPFETKNNYQQTIAKIIEMVENKKSPLSIKRMESVMRMLDLIWRSGNEKSILKVNN